MKKKERCWPFGITGFLIFFTALVIGAGVGISRIRYDLVAPDYYDQEIAYEAHLDSIRRAQALSEGPTLKAVGRALWVQFPPSLASRVRRASVHLYYAADKQHDVHAELDVSSGETMTLDLGARPGGNWRVTLEWILDGETYRISRRERMPS